MFERISCPFQINIFLNSVFWPTGLHKSDTGVIMLCNTSTTSKNTSKRSAHTPDGSANGTAAILTHPHHIQLRQRFPFLSQSGLLGPQKKMKIKETTADKFKNTTVKFRKLGEFLWHYFYTESFHNWSLTSISSQLCSCHFLLLTLVCKSHTSPLE